MNIGYRDKYFFIGNSDKSDIQFLFTSNMRKHGFKSFYNESLLRAAIINGDVDKA